MPNSRIVLGGIDAAVRIGKALDHPLRVRALAALTQGELCVCELIELFGLAPSTVSKHMSIIADAGLVMRRRDRKWIYYTLPAIPEGPIAHALDLVGTLVADDPLVLDDKSHLPAINCQKA